MCDERESTFYERRAKVAISRFKKNNINAYYFKERSSACSKIFEMIPPGALVGFGDSITLNQLGIILELKKKGNCQLIDPFERTDRGLAKEVPGRRIELMRKALISDIFITGSNAITLDGKIVNIDGLGNRVAGIIFGPKKVIIVVGGNKLVADVEEGIRRIKNVAAPKVALLHYEKHGLQEMENLPCVKKGICNECNSTWKICNYVVIINQHSNFYYYNEPRINVIIIGEDLGI